MTLKPYLIAPYQSGLQDNVEPWLLPEDAFQFLVNAYVWRGRLRKRVGSAYLGNSELESRLRINLGTTNGSGDFSITVPGTVFSIGQMFSIGTEIFTVNVLGTPGTLLDSGGATLATYDTTNGSLVITGSAATTACFFYPAQPVMGLRIRERTNINFERTIGFDPQFAYQRTGGGWSRLGTALWSGTNSNFFWTVNYRGSTPSETFFYVVNNVEADNIKYLDSTGSTWTNLRPQLNTGNTRHLETARLIVGFKDRLLVLNTTEEDGANDFVFKNRVRWSQNGDPTNPVNSWLDDTPGRGGFVDASTQEAIITAEFIQDRLIVYFERSTWELVYTGDSTLPFRWQQLNNELGAESTFSIVGFDQAAVGIGNVGIHTCNGTNVVRIDQKIPDLVFKLHNSNEGPERVYGIRDYFKELVYWAYPDAGLNPTFPNRMLVWNYKNLSWAEFEDSFTCFGYFQKDSAVIWSQLGTSYGSWTEWNTPWGGPRNQAQFSLVAAGNQQGFTFVLNPDKSSNSQSLYITDMTAGSSQLTVINHNLKQEEYVLVEEAVGITSLNNLVFQVQEVVNANTIILDTTFSGTYQGGGKLTRISQINITSKQWNPGTPIGLQFRLPYIDFLIDRTESGEVSVNYFLDSSQTLSIQDSAAPGVLLGNNTLRTRPENSSDFQPHQVRIWHRYFLQLEGQSIQIRIFLTDSQLRDLSISQSDFQLSGMILYVAPEGRLVE